MSLYKPGDSETKGSLSDSNHRSFVDNAKRVIELKKQLAFYEPSLLLDGDPSTIIAVIDGLPQRFHPSLESVFIQLRYPECGLEDIEANVHAISIASMFSGDDPRILGL